MGTATAVTPWYKVYSGEKECRFFKALARNKNYAWRTTASLAKEARLKESEVEDIANKYKKTGQVVSGADGKWSYFERAGSPSSAPKAGKTVTFEGEVVKRRVNKGTKSERVAVQIAVSVSSSSTGYTHYTLRRKNNPNPLMQDPTLDKLVGKTIEVTGTLNKRILIIDTYKELVTP